MSNGKIKIRAPEPIKKISQEDIEGFREPSDTRFGAFKMMKEAANVLGYNVSDPERDGKYYTLRLLTQEGVPFTSVTLAPCIHTMPIEDAANRIRDLVIEAVASGSKDPAIKAKVLTEEFTTN